MAATTSEKKPQPKNCEWNDADDMVMLECLKLQKSQGRNWGDNNPKSQAFQECVELLKGSEKVSGGKEKDQTCTKTRWSRVSG